MAETARSMVFSLLPVLVARRCHKDATMTGFMLSYHGLIGGLVQGVLIAPLTARYRDDQILLGAVLGLACSYFMWCYCHSTFWFSILMVTIRPLFSSRVSLTVLARGRFRLRWATRCSRRSSPRC